MPESMSSCGELTVPALRITSREAVTRWIPPAASRYSTPDRPGPVEQNPLGVSPGEDGQVGPPLGGPQVRVRGAVPQTAALGHRRRCISGVVRLVEFAETAQAQLGTRSQERQCGRVRVAQLGDELRARGAIHPVQRCCPRGALLAGSTAAPPHRTSPDSFAPSRRNRRGAHVSTPAH